MKVSVVIPCYNSEKYITRCIDSIPNGVEIICVDDGSTDSTVEILKNNPRVKLLQQEHAGPGIARNLGVKNATGDYIMFVDSDDYIYPHVFNAITQYCSDYDLIWTARERNDGYSWVSRYSLQGCLIRKSLIEDVEHNNKLHGEDTDFLRKVIVKPHTEITINKPPVYHYNLNVLPNGEVDGVENSLTWRRKRGLLND